MTYCFGHLKLGGFPWARLVARLREAGSGEQLASKYYSPFCVFNFIPIGSFSLSFFFLKNWDISDM